MLISNFAVKIFYMTPTRYFFLKGNEKMIDHVKSVNELGCLYWRKSTRRFNVGDVIYLYLSHKGFNRICYRCEVVDTSAPRKDEACWHATFVADDSTYKFIPTSKLYVGDRLGLTDLQEIGIDRHTQFQRLSREQVQAIENRIAEAKK